jgi:hypothetical protein
MCLIVDANCAGSVFVGVGPDEFEPVRRALLGQKIGARLALGGHLVQEYQRAGVLKVVLELDRAGRAFGVDDAEVSRLAEQLKDGGLLRSNDSHVIALALVSKVRLLVSLDKPLHKDFTNPALISKPRGKVYQKRSHAHLLQSHCSRE